METEGPFDLLPEMDALRCDLCSSTPVVKIYDCPDITVSTAQGGLEGVEGITCHGAWAACDDCAALIEAGDQEGVLARGLAAVTEEYQREQGIAPHSGVLALTREVQRLFFARRTGRVAHLRES